MIFNDSTVSLFNKGQFVHLLKIRIFQGAKKLILSSLQNVFKKIIKENAYLCYLECYRISTIQKANSFTLGRYY